MTMSRWVCLCLGLTLGATPATAQNAVQRGKKALESRSLVPATWTVEAYENAWQFWQPKPTEKPEDYDRAFRDYYGLHPAPYPNGGYPMGIRKSSDGTGLSFDCMVCHGGSILGKSYVGLGNASLDLQALYEDMGRASGQKGGMPIAVSNVRGINEAFGLTELLLSVRNPDLSRREKPLEWEFADDLCEDVPAWWHLKRKATVYHTGSTSAKSVRTLMQFMLNRGNALADFQREEATFRDIQAYLLSLEPPKYPFPVKKEVAAGGRKLFVSRCAKCHGTYGPEGKYPSKIVLPEDVGTDVRRLEGFSQKYVDVYNKSWFAGEKPEAFRATRTPGYQAPPLDGVWATAPYFHNGSVPTLYGVLNSKARPRVFTRSYRTDEADYDKAHVGWRTKVLAEVPKDLSSHERRKIYDTTQSGRGNGGHTFGDGLTDEERFAIIEYLKTL
jgi:mono/diheme cytochrome c family protein